MTQSAEDHVIEITPFAGRVRVQAGGEAIADTAHALLLEEAGYDPVFYIPADDVAMHKLTANPDHSHCPHKGDADYFDFGDTRQIAWSYRKPFLAVREIAGHIAFYPGKATIEHLPFG